MLGAPKQKASRRGGFLLCSGGEGGIRTHGRVAPTLDFESSTFDHSATSPGTAFSYSSLLWRRGWDSNPRMGRPIA